MVKTAVFLTDKGSLIIIKGLLIVINGSLIVIKGLVIVINGSLIVITRLVSVSRRRGSAKPPDVSAEFEFRLALTPALSPRRGGIVRCILSSVM